MAKDLKRSISLYTGKPVSRQAMNFKEHINDLEYTVEPYKTPRTIVRGVWHGYAYSVQNTGPYPIAHVAVPKGHKLYGLHPKDPAMTNLSPHGLIRNTGSKIPRSPSTISNKWWITWEYAEITDYLGFYQSESEIGGYSGKQWTGEEIVAEVKEFITKLEKM